MARDARLNRRTGQDAARILELTDEVADLHRQIDTLAEDRDRLVEKLREARAALAEATRPPACVKVRHLHQEDAYQHAVMLAFAQPGDLFHTYDTCRSCDVMPIFQTAPWHVSHCKCEPACDGHVVSHDGRLLEHGCGCRHSRTGEHLWVCRAHMQRGDGISA